jgi:hypothetical protein
MTVFLFPYKLASEGAKNLAHALGIKKLKQEGSKFVGNKKKLVINWGNSETNKEIENSSVLNLPNKVAKVTNKLAFFKVLEGTHVRVPDWTDNYEDARTWIKEGKIVVARTKLNGHSGEGIVIAETLDDLPKAPLYTLYKPKKSEFRVHIMKERVIDVQRKALDKDFPKEKINWKVRNLDGGFIFARNDGLGLVPDDVYDQAVDAVIACGLHFGAVDVIYNEKEKKAYVLEINTAPGLMGETVEIYANAFREFYQAWFHNEE